jgi:hypothetical protein
MSLIAMRGRAGRPWVVGLVMIVTLTAMLVVSVGKAPTVMAYNCAGWTYAPVDDGTARADVYLETMCDDDWSRVHGTVYDELCDGRSARLDVYFIDAGGYLSEQSAYDRYGCGTGNPYLMMHNDPEPREFMACVYSYNTWGRSSGDCTGWIYLWYP